MRCHRVLLVALALGIVANACVLPEDQRAAELQQVPRELLTTTTGVAVSAEPEPEDPSYEFLLFWHDDNDQLHRVGRVLDSPPSIEEALTQLLGGPSDEEAVLDDGTIVSNRVVPALGPTARRLENDILVITVADDFAFRDREADKIPITEELVCTLIGIEGVVALTIEDSAGEITLTDKAAQVITGPATRSDFGDCVPKESEVDVTTPEGDDTTTQGEDSAPQG